MTRNRKTPRQRAEEVLGIAERRVAKLDKAIAEAESQLAELRLERADAVRRHEYAQSDPALRDETLDDEGDDDQEGTTDG